MNLNECEVVRLKGRTISGDPAAIRSVECDPDELMTWCLCCGAVGFARRARTECICQECAEEVGRYE
jgi:hypothetical protein